MFLKNRNIISKIKRSKVTDYAALSRHVGVLPDGKPGQFLLCEYFFSDLELFLVERQVLIRQGPYVERYFF